MNQPPNHTTSTQAVEKSEGRRRIASQEILGGAACVEIEHAGQRYLLRVTRENKLILTK